MLINFVDATNDANHYTKPPYVFQFHYLFDSFVDFCHLLLFI